MSDTSTTGGPPQRPLQPLSPAPRRWSEIPPEDVVGPQGTSPGGSPFGVRTQAVIDDVERMLSRLSDAAEAAEAGSHEGATTTSRDSFHTAPSEMEGLPQPRLGPDLMPQDTLQPPLRPFLSTRRSAEALRPRSDGMGISKLDPARMSLFSPSRSEVLKKAKSGANLSELFHQKKNKEGSAFSGPDLAGERAGATTPTRSRLIGRRDSPLRRSFRPEEPVSTPVAERIVRPRSTPPREESTDNQGLLREQQPSPSKDMFGPRIKPTLPPRKTPTEASSSSSFKTGSATSIPRTQPLNTPRMPPPLPPRTHSSASSVRDRDDLESISGSSINYTPSEAGRDLEQALRSMGSTQSTSIGSLLDSTESDRYSIGPVSARNVPLPASPASSRVAPPPRDVYDEEERDGQVRTPRPLNLPPREPVTPVSNNPYPKPARSWVRDPYVARTLDNMGIEGPRRELLTPVEERTERTKSWSSGSINVEPIGKPLPLVPPIEGLPRTPFYNTASTPERAPAKASNLIKFFENAGGSPVAPQGSSDSVGHARGMSAPDARRQEMLPEARTAVTGYQGSGFLASQPTRAPLATIEPAAAVFAHPEPSAVASLRKSSTSPLRSMRNVVAAWRGRVLPHSRSSSVHQPKLGQDSDTANPELIAGQHENDQNSREKGVFDDAFVTIRRMSTRRRNARDSPAPPYEGPLSPVSYQAPSLVRTMGLEKPLPTIRDEAQEGARKPRGQVVSTYTEMTTEPRRIGELWYLNVHGGEPYTWIKCDAELFEDRLVLSWIPEDSRGSRGVVTLDLTHCQEVRSIPSPNHQSARDDIGSIAARSHADPTLADTLYPFQMVYEDGLERLGSGSARDRVRWVSAIWDVLEHGPDRSNILDGSTAGSSETGSRTTRLEGPRAASSEPQQNAYRNSRALDDVHVHDSQGNMMGLSRGTSKRLTGRSGSMLRRIASEADLEIGLDSMHHVWEGASTARDTSQVRDTAGLQPDDLPSFRAPPLSPSTTLLTETDIGPSASMSGQTPGFASAQSDVFGSAFSQHTLGRRGARRIPPSRESAQLETLVETSTVTDYHTPGSAVTGAGNSYLTPGSNITGVDSQATIRPANRRRASDESDAMSAVMYQTGFLDMLEEGSVMDDYQTASQGLSAARRREPLGPRHSLRRGVPRRDTRGTNYFTATQGTEASYMSATSGRFSSAVSSDGHAMSAIDRVSATSATSSRSNATSTRKSTTIVSSETVSVVRPPSKSSTALSLQSSKTPSLTTGSSRSSGSSSHVSTASSTTVQADTRTTSIDRPDVPAGLQNQLSRIEEQVAGIGSYLATKPRPTARRDASARTSTNAARSHSSPSSSSSSSGSSSSSDSLPTTPTESRSGLHRNLAEIRDGVDEILDRSDAMFDEQQKLRELFEEQLPLQKDSMPGRVPTLHRIEDLLLRLLVRSGDSEILDEAGFRKDMLAADSPNRSASAHSRFSTDETDTSVFSNEDGLRAPPPPGSLATNFRQSRRGDDASQISSSLLVTTPRIDGELDERWELQNLPDGSPPPQRERHRPAPPDLSYLRRPGEVPEQFYDDEDAGHRSDSQQDAVSPGPSPQLRPAPTPRPVPVPGRQGQDLSRPPESRTPTPPRPRTHRPGPMPEPLHIPSPVMPGRPSNMASGSFRPNPSMTMPMPRPSRLAGTREPMTTTYFRRGFPPPMFPPPMVGPHMGPYRAGVPPGLPGFGGPFGPNVFPRPGYPAPGAAGGSYGLPRRPFFPSRPPRGDLTPLSRDSRTVSYTDYSDQSSDGTLEEVKDAVEHLDQVQHHAIDKAQALAEAQGQQTNEIGRYLHELGEVMDSNRKDHFEELLTLHEDIGKIRDQIAQGGLNAQTEVKIIPPAEEAAPEPPPKATAIPVQVSQVPDILAPALPPAQTSVSVNIPVQAPPAAIMSVHEHSEDGGSPVMHSPVPLSNTKDAEQDAMLRDLQKKVAILLQNMAGNDRTKMTEYEVVHEPTGTHPGDKETIKITEVQQGPGPLPPKSKDSGDKIRITEIHTGPAMPSPPSMAPTEAIPTIIPSGPLTAPMGTPSVHFAPEHVKETVTEASCRVHRQSIALTNGFVRQQVIRGPGSTPVIEKETIREYDRTSSDVAAGRAPQHETIIEKETVTGADHEHPDTLERTTENFHDTHAPVSVAPPSTTGSVRVPTHHPSVASEVIQHDTVEVVRTPSRRTTGSRSDAHVPKTTVTVAEDSAGHPVITTTIEEHDVGGRYPHSVHPPTTIAQDPSSHGSDRRPVVTVPGSQFGNMPPSAGPPPATVITQPGAPSVMAPGPPAATAYDPTHRSNTPTSVAQPAATVVADPATGGLVVKPVPTVVPPVASASNVKPATSGLDRDRPVVTPDVPVQLTPGPTVQPAANIPTDSSRPSAATIPVQDRPTSLGNIPSAPDVVPISRPASVASRKPPPPRPVFEDGDPMSAPASAPGPVIPDAPAPQNAANIPIVEETRRPPGVLKKQPPTATPSSAPGAHQVRFETPADVARPPSAAPVATSANVPSTPPASTTANVPSAPPATTAANVPSAPVTVQPPVQAGPASVAPGTQSSGALPPASNVHPNVQPGAPQSVKPVRERPVVIPGPVTPTPGPTVAHDVPQAATHHNLPSGGTAESIGNVPASGSGGPIDTLPASYGPGQRPGSTYHNVPDVIHPAGSPGPAVKQKPISTTTVQRPPSTQPIQNIPAGSSPGNLGVSDPAQIPVSDPSHRPNVLRKPPPPGTVVHDSTQQPGTVVRDSVQPSVQHNVPSADMPDGVELVEGQAAPVQSAPVQSGPRPNVLKKPPPPAKSGHSGQSGQSGHPGQPGSAGQPGQRVDSIANVPSASQPGSTSHAVPGAIDPNAHADGTTVTPPLRQGLPSGHGAPGQPGATVLPDGTSASKPPIIVPGKAPGSTAQSVSPEAALAERDRIAAQSKANAEKAEQERLEKERLQKEHDAAVKLAADRHKEHQDALADIKRTLHDNGSHDTKWKETFAQDAKAKEKRRVDKSERDKKWQEAIDKLTIERDNDKKWRDTEAKKPGNQAVIDYLKKHNDDLTAFLRALAADLVAQNVNQHQQTQQAAKAWAREQVAFNLSGYLDDFSKALSSEVRALLKEVGDLRETRRALYYELAELLLMKGRQSHGDLMAVLPFPTANGVGPGPGIGLPKGAPPKPNPPAPKPEPPKPAPPPVPPAWQSYNLPPNMTIGNPGQPPSNVPSGKGGKPPGGSRPLPTPSNVVMTTTTTTHPA